MDSIATVQYILLSLYMISGQLMQSTLVFSPKELISNSKSISNSSVKLALRYGFHRTSECDNYEKAFLCVQKCVDKGYDVAYSDKYCFCTCYVKKEKAKYTPEHKFTRTKWKLGTPTTTMPPWIKKLSTDVKNKTKSKAPKENVTDIVGNITNVANVTNATEKSPVGDLVTAANNVTANQTTSEITNNLNGTAPQNVTVSDNKANATNISEGQNSTHTTIQNATIAGNQNVTTDTSKNLSNSTSTSQNHTVSDVKNSTSNQNASAVKS